MSDEPKPDDPKPEEPRQRGVGEAFRLRLERDVLPRLADPKNMRSAVAVRVMSIVDRQIGQGDASAKAEWQDLREFVKDHPAGLAVVENLEAAVTKYEQNLEKQIAAGADEAQVRKSAAGLINMAVMSKIKDPPKGYEEGQAEEGEKADPSGPETKG